MTEVPTPEEQSTEEEKSEGQGIFGPPSEMTDEEREAAEAAGFVFSTEPAPEVAAESVQESTPDPNESVPGTPTSESGEPSEAS